MGRGFREHRADPARSRWSPSSLRSRTVSGGERGSPGCGACCHLPADALRGPSCQEKVRRGLECLPLHSHWSTPRKEGRCPHSRTSPLIANTSPQSGHRQEARAVGGLLGDRLRPPPARPTAAPRSPPAPGLPSQANACASPLWLAFRVSSSRVEERLGGPLCRWAPEAWSGWASMPTLPTHSAASVSRQATLPRCLHDALRALAPPGPPAPSRAGSPGWGLR